MGKRITSVTSPEFDALFTGFRHTAYRLEILQQYDVSYEIDTYRRFLAGETPPRDEAKNAWTEMLDAARRDGKIVQRVHVVTEPLTDYLRYELEWSYPPNVEAGEDIRILPAGQLETADLSRLGILGDYWLFDSRDLWVMSYASDGTFEYIEPVDDIDAGWMVVDAAYWRDAALHWAIPYRDYVRRRELLAAS